ncbi:MAG: Tat pathway signal sequence [Lachnospiraceae bacterium]|nr:Tat pathway signal sequence [Lachnospiraceae bacterium]MCI9592125.1 Tat pathway signal sequence [Lachnospiraceae bacterium]
MSFFGVIVTGFCIGAFQKANLGADPFTCFVTGIANIFHSTYSTFYIIVTGALLVGVFFVEKHYIGIATVINLFFTGMAADFMRNILDNIFPAPGMAARFVMMLFGIFGTCFAASVYFTADLGVSAYDAWSLIAANKYKLMPFRLCRIASDSVCVLTGLIFHVTIGVGTVITALFMGPVVQWFNTNVSEPFLYGHKGTQ